MRFASARSLRHRSPASARRRRRVPPLRPGEANPVGLGHAVPVGDRIQRAGRRCGSSLVVGHVRARTANAQCKERRRITDRVGRRGELPVDEGNGGRSPVHGVGIPRIAMRPRRPPQRQRPQGRRGRRRDERRRGIVKASQQARQLPELCRVDLVIVLPRRRPRREAGARCRRCAPRRPRSRARRRAAPRPRFQSDDVDAGSGNHLCAASQQIAMGARFVSMIVVSE